MQTAQGALDLALAGRAGGQPAAAAWIESNAIPWLHYFAPFVEAAAQPRPSLQLEQGDAVQTVLAPPVVGPVALDVAFRGRLGGARLEVLVDGQSLGVAGDDTTDWQVARFRLSSDTLAGKSTLNV